MENYPDIHRDIIEKCKKGDSKAQYELYSLYAKAMFNVSFRIMNHRHDAEDMLQEAFTEAFRKLDSFRYESTFGAWLKRIVVNKCINTLKKRKIELSFKENIYKYDTEDNDDLKETELTIKNIHSAIEKLAAGYRIVLTLYLLEGYDHAEVAKMLGITESTSKSQYLRAKQRLREILKN